MRRSLPTGPTLLLLFAYATATAATLPMAKHQITPEGKTLAHPKQGLIELPRVTSPLSRALLLCAHYGTTLKRQRGRVFVTFELYRSGELLETVKFDGRIRNADEDDDEYVREFLECSKAICPEPSDPEVDCEEDSDAELNTILEEGDTFLVIFEYRKLRALDTRHVAEVAAGVFPAGREP